MDMKVSSSSEAICTIRIPDGTSHHVSRGEPQMTNEFRYVIGHGLIVERYDQHQPCARGPVDPRQLLCGFWTVRAEWHRTYRWNQAHRE